MERDWKCEREKEGRGLVLLSKRKLKDFSPSFNLKSLPHPERFV